MSKLQSKRQMETYSGKRSSNNHARHHRYFTRQAFKEPFLYFEDDDEDPIMKRRLRYSRRHFPYPIRKNRTQVASYPLQISHEVSTLKTSDVNLEAKTLSATAQLSEYSCTTSSEKEFRSTVTTECEPDAPLDRVSRDEIVRKVSTCLSFYGNFVIIPAVKETLNRIEEMDKNVKFSYWHEVMTFIDSYDLPYVSESRKKLVDKLVKTVTKYVQKEGISAHAWQTILCTLPDDVSSKFDHRLEGTTMEEVETLAKQDRLPFNLSVPILQILQSAKKHAGKYIRHNKAD